VAAAQTDTAWNEDTALKEVIGYVNYSQGRADAKFQRNINELYRAAASTDSWQVLGQRLRECAARLRGTSPAFQDIAQAEAVLSLVFDHTLPAYRAHHSDLLRHVADADLFQPFLLVRVIEAVLATGGPWDATDRIVAGVLQRLNDFVGHRPIAVLENRRKSEPYDHERVRPIPLYIRGAGVAYGKYHDLVARALEILTHTNSDILAAAHFHLDQLGELALDPRVYDFGHPVNQRPNYQFGEWDPHSIDGQGRYQRFVVRQVTLDALMRRVEQGVQSSGEQGVQGSGFRVQAESPVPPEPRTPNPEPSLFESAAVLAGTMLMASATSGRGPDAHDSSVTLATLVPLIAQFRDAFYTSLLESTAGPLGEQLRREAMQLHQPFGGVRQSLNHYLAELRATQLQQVQLRRLFGQMGYPGVTPPAVASSTPAALPVSARFLCEIDCRITSGHLQLDRGDWTSAAAEAEPLEAILQRGIRCGAVVDPWNILGFQGQYSVFAALENSVPDPRVDELVAAVGQILALLSRVRVEAAAAGDAAMEQRTARQLERLAVWWDRFASGEVSSVERVSGAEFVESSRHTARALAAWRGAGTAAGDIRFWREHSQGFTSPRAFSDVIHALLEKNDRVAAMALLMNWLSQAEQAPLEQDPHSFHSLAVRWLASTRKSETEEPGSPRTQPAHAVVDWSLVTKFFDFMEANADTFWHVPALQLGKTAAELSEELADTGAEPDDAGDEDQELFGAAYDGVTFRDSAEDGHDGSVLDGSVAQGDFELEAAAERIEPRLEFLTTVATLWQIVAEWMTLSPDDMDHLADFTRSCMEHARRIRRDLLVLAGAIQATTIPRPLGSHDSMVEFDRRRATKESLIEQVAATQVETATAHRMLMAVAPGGADIQWEALAAEFHRALHRHESAELRTRFPELLGCLAKQPILYRPLAKNGSAAEIVAARCVQRVIADLVRQLARAGLVRESFAVLKTAQHMERSHPVRGEGISEFDRLFRTALVAACEAVVLSADHWDLPRRGDSQLLECLEQLTEHYVAAWLEHSKTIRLSVLDRVGGGDEWRRIGQFIEIYGHDLFVPKFMALANLRSILDQGVERFLDYLGEDRDPLHPIRLIDDLDRVISRRDACRTLELILQVFVENYVEYKDYLATAAQAAYGERFFTLLDFLQLKAFYARAEWNLRPLVMVHAVLARLGRQELAERWQEAMAQRTAELADNIVRRLAELESRHGTRIRTVRDRLQERFVRPLALDRIIALVEPVMSEAFVSASGDAGPAFDAADSDAPPTTGSFRRLLAELREFSETPIGSGLDVPHWLQELHRAVQVERERRRAQPRQPKTAQTTPHAIVSLTALRQQLDRWNDPLS
jgi:hypothetical protein